MIKINTYEEYTSVINTMIQSHPGYITNSYLMRDNIIRLINLNRLYYMQLDGLTILYDDEMDYYQCYVYWDKEHNLVIPAEDKLISLMYISVDGLENVEMDLFKEKLMVNGFRVGSKMRQVIYNNEEQMRNIDKEYEAARELFHARGYCLDYPTKENIRGIRKVQHSLETVPIYQIPYLTEEELIEEGKCGKQICVLDSKGDVVAAAGHFEDKGSTNYIGILKEHRIFSGIATILAAELFSHAADKSEKSKAWIDEKNMASIAYQQSIGCQWGNRVMEYLIRE